MRVLLTALVSLHIANPLLSRLELGGIVLTGIVGALFLSGVYSMYERRSAVIVGLITGVPFFVVTLVEAVRTHGSDSSSTGLLAGAASAPFSLYVALSILRYVFARSVPLDDRLVGAACVYMLLGGAWSGVYTAIELVVPGSFVVVTDPDAVVTWPLLQYFSLVTLTTLGYGDVVPVSDAARSAATLEAVTGILYTVLVVARLVTVLREDDQSQDAAPTVD